MVHPTPAETIRGIRQILKDVVEPHLASEYARGRLREVRAVLNSLDWDDPAAGVQREIGVLQQVLDEARAWAADDPDRASGLGDTGGVEQTAGSSFAAICAYRDEVAQQVIDANDRLRAWSRAHPGDRTEVVLARMLEVMAS